MQSFKKFLEKYTTIPKEDWEMIRDSFVRKEFAKDELILSEGMICKHFYFLEEGLVRFFIHHDGEDLTTFFVDAPYCFTAKDSFHDRVPARENIQTLAPCVVWQTTLEKISILSGLKSWEQFTRSFIHEVQGYIEHLMITNKILSAEERYVKLLELHPDLTQRIPLKYLAGFLGIAPQSLSRIRKKFQKKIC